MVRNFKRAKEFAAFESSIAKKRKNALKKNVKRRKGTKTTARDQELMFGY